VILSRVDALLSLVVLPLALFLIVLVLVLVVLDYRSRLRRAERHVNYAEAANLALAAQLLGAEQVEPAPADALRLAQVELRPAAPRQWAQVDDARRAGIPDAPAVIISPTYVGPDVAVWLADYREGVFFHRLDEQALATECDKPVRLETGGGRGVTMPAAAAVANWQARPCPKCFPQLPVIPGKVA